MAKTRQIYLPPQGVHDDCVWDNLGEERLLTQALATFTAAAPLLRHLLFGVAATDPIVLAAVALAILASASAALYFPHAGRLESIPYGLCGKSDARDAARRAPACDMVLCLDERCAARLAPAGPGICSPAGSSTTAPTAWSFERVCCAK